MPTDHLSPEVICFLRGTVARYCNDHHISSSGKRMAAGISALRLYQSGVTDRYALLRRLEAEDRENSGGPSVRRVDRTDH